MKVLKVIGILFVILIVLIAVGVFVAVKTFDVQKLKAQIAQSATEAIKRDVVIGDLSFVFDWKQGFSLQVKDVTVKDDPTFSEGNFLEVSSVYANLNIAQFVSKRRIVVTAVELKTPHVALIRNKEGALNIPQHPAEEKKVAVYYPTFTLGATPAEAADNAQVNELIKNFLVSKVSLSDGVVRFTDHMVEPAMEIVVNDLDVNASNVSVSKSFPFDAKASILSAKQNMIVKGNLAVDIATGSIEATQVHFETDLAQIDNALLLKTVPAVSQLQLAGPLAGQFFTDVSSLKVLPSGQIDVTAKGQLADGKIVTKYLKLPVDNIDVNFEVANNDLVISQIFCYLATGKVNGKAKVAGIFGKPALTFTMAGEDIDAAEVIDQSKLPVKIQGKAGFNAEGGIADLTAEKPETLLVMQMTAGMTEGKILNVNVLKLVINSLSMIPGFSENIQAKLSPEEKARLEQKDTVITKLEVKGQAQGGQFLLNPIDVDADGFMMHAEGSMTFDQMADMNAEYLLPESISSTMIDTAPQLSALLTAEGRVRIPAKHYSGPVAKMALGPDVAYLSKTVLQEYGRSELEKVLNKAMGRDEEAVPAQGNAAPAPAQGNTAEPQKPEDVMIDNVFDAIFGSKKK